MRNILLILCFFIFGQAGAQWQNMYSFPNPGYSMLNCNNNLYVGLGGGGVYTSLDGGITWSAVNNGIQFGGAYIFSLTSRNDSIYAGGFGEVCFTNDSGANWTLQNLNLWLNSNVYALLIKDNYIFAGVGHDTSNGVYRKLLNGTSWVKTSNGMPPNNGINALVIHNNNLFAGTESGVYVSSDNGLNWIASNNGIGNLSVKSLISNNGNILAGTANGIYLSSNNGSTWTTTAGLKPNSVVTCFTSNNNYIVTGTYESAYYSPDNGSTWIQISNGLDSIVSFYSMASLGNYVYASTGHGISTTNSTFRLDYNTLSTFESLHSFQIKISPNPFSTQAVLHSDHLMNNATLTVRNICGQNIAQTSNISGHSFVLNREDLPNGLYFVQLTEGNKNFTGKLIITDR